MKMPIRLDTKMFAPCGMNCLLCYKHCYTKKTRSPCGGCFHESKGKPEHCRKCKIKDCVQSKTLTYCYQCNAFPCKLIKNLERSYNQRYQESLIENSMIAKTEGVMQLLHNHASKYQCPACGGIISYHDKVCFECNKMKK